MPLLLLNLFLRLCLYVSLAPLTMPIDHLHVLSLFHLFLEGPPRPMMAMCFNLSGNISQSFPVSTCVLFSNG